jgi:hypothetical protein
VTAARAVAPLRLAAAAGGLLVALSMSGPWAQRGLGSSLSGRALADLLLAGTVESVVPRWAGAALYLIPVCGALAVVAAGLPAPVGPRVLVGAALAAAALDLAVSLALDGRPLRAPGWGAVVLHAGAVLALAAAIGLLVATARSSSTTGSGPTPGTRWSWWSGRRR